VTTPPRTLAVIGAGFSGVSLAAHLARLDWPNGLRVVLIERGPAPARGVAYSTPRAIHLLNVPAGRMGALADNEGDFLAWLRRVDPAVAGDEFVPRGIYGDYLTSILDALIASPPPGFSVEIRSDEATDIEPRADGVRVSFASGATLDADAAVLATGTPAPRGPQSVARVLGNDNRFIADPWAPGALDGLRTELPILVIGTGLTMVDVVLALRESGHRGGFVAVSRRGILPQSHRDWPKPPPPIDLSEKLAGWDGTASALLSLLRDASHHADLAGLDWRDVINGLRSRTPALWARMPHRERERFLRHVRPYWETHRHRMSTRVATDVNALLFRGELAVLAGEIASCTVRDEAIDAHIRPRGKSSAETRRVGFIVNCTGPDCDYAKSDEPLFAALRARGLYASDPLRMGLPGDAYGALLDANGKPSRVLFTLGNPRKSDLWESTAVPELRAQASQLATYLHAGAHG